MMENEKQKAEKKIRYLDVSFNNLKSKSPFYARIHVGSSNSANQPLQIRQKIKTSDFEVSIKKTGELNAAITEYMENVVFQFAKHHVSEEDSQRYLFHFKNHRLLPEVAAAKREEKKANRPKKERFVKTYTEKEKAQMAVKARKRYKERPEIRLKMAASHLSRQICRENRNTFLESCQKIIVEAKNDRRFDNAKKKISAIWAQYIIYELPQTLDIQVHNNITTAKCSKCEKRVKVDFKTLRDLKRDSAIEGEAYLYCTRACKET